MKLLRLAVVAFALVSTPVLAQWQTPNHSVPVGRGVGKQGFGASTGTSGQALFGVTGADPAFRAPSFTDLTGNIAVGQINGGTGASTSTYLRGDGTWQIPVVPSPVECLVGTGYYASIAAAFSACPNNATIRVLQSQTVNSSVIIPSSSSNLRLTCNPGVNIIMGGGGGAYVRFEISAANFEADNCIYVGPGTNVGNRGQLFLFFAQKATFHHNYVTQFGSTGTTPGSNGIVQWLNGSGQGKGYNNTFVNNNDFDMSLQASNVSDYLFANNAMSDLLVFGGSYDSIGDVRISNNYFTAGSFNSNESLCSFIANVANLTFTGNVCQHVGNTVAGIGGTYSFAQISDFTIANNTYLTNGFTYEDYSFEFNHMRQGSITGNFAQNDSGTHGQGMVCESCQMVSFTGNVQNGWKGGGPNNPPIAGFSFPETYAVPSFSRLSGLTITGNSGRANGAAQGVIGIAVQNYASTTFTSLDIVVANNALTGGQTGVSNAPSTGVLVDGGSTGGMNNILVGPNSIRAFDTGVQIGSSVSNYCVLPGANYATTASAGAGASACH